MGTPDISAACLDALLRDGAPVVAAVTREDKPKGRKMVLTPPPVKVLAEEHGIPVYQPKTLRDEAFASLLRDIDPDLILVVAYGKLLPESVLFYPKYGCINLHVSLLPKYRGAAPMQRAIMEGERETGVTVMYMDAGLDTGDIITAESFPILPSDDFESIHDRSAEVGARLLCAVVRDIADGKDIPRKKQDDAAATYAPKIEKADCHIDFTKSAVALDPYIRGITPIPMAYAIHRGAMLKICAETPTGGHGAPGEVLALSAEGDGYILVACGEGALAVTSVIPEGKKRMRAADFIRGRNIEKGDILS